MRLPRAGVVCRFRTSAARTAERQNCGTAGSAERRSFGASELRNFGTTAHRNDGTPELRNTRTTDRRTHRSGARIRAPRSQKTQKTLKVRPATSRDFCGTTSGRRSFPRPFPFFNRSGVRRRHCRASPFCAFARGSGRSARSAIRGSRSSVVPQFRRSVVPWFRRSAVPTFRSPAASRP